MVAIHQKKGQEVRDYKITENGLEAVIRSKGQSQSYNINFEDIEFNEVAVKSHVNTVEIGLFISVFVNLFLILFLFYTYLDITVISAIAIGIVAGMGIWSVQLFKTKPEKIFKGPQTLFFFYGSREKPEVNQFLTELQSAQRIYIRKKYMRIDDFIPWENQEQNFYWLYKRNFISRNEMELLVEELDNRKIINEK